MTIQSQILPYRDISYVYKNIVTHLALWIQHCFLTHLSLCLQLHYKVQGLISRGLIRLQQIDKDFLGALKGNEEAVVSMALSLLGGAQQWIEKPAEILRSQAEQITLEREDISR
jgi:hypothetical protein